ncbi:MAG: C45 family autoproteolytic acyltransferase/hydrolase [Verrucomicrobiota bacterium]
MRKKLIIKNIPLTFVALAGFFACTFQAKAQNWENVTLLAEKISPFFQTVQAEKAKIHADIKAPFGHIQVDLRKNSPDELLLSIEHADYAVTVWRNNDSSVLYLPRHNSVFRGDGKVPEEDSLAIPGILTRFISADTAAYTYAQSLSSITPETLAILLVELGKLKPQTETEKHNKWTSALMENGEIKFSPDEKKLRINAENIEVNLQADSLQSTSITEPEYPEDVSVTELPRAEIERTLVRGIRRLLEVEFPSEQAQSENFKDRLVDNGQLTSKDGTRVAILEGTPQEIGRAQGELLKDEITACTDSVLYLIGLGETVRSGDWFLNNLREARKRTREYTPDRYYEELAAIAESTGINREMLELSNIFPEYFHCSGFAVWGEATVDGTLYHGRVLDYMTGIGLEDAATLFIIKPVDHATFVNYGYAGFIGSVTGMNEHQIGMGEMGGRGRGKWDGIPMAYLMRRALEESRTITEVQDLWRNSSLTCEYYYVFSDAKIPDAVGVYATPENLEFVGGGEDHPELGKGIPNSVLISAGDRLEKLKKRVKKNYGEIDEKQAIELMSRPVAMSSNLHNALLIPETMTCYVSHASRQKLAAEREYVKIDVDKLLDEFSELKKQAE